VRKRLRTQLTFSYWWHQLSSHKWLTLNQSCWSWSQGQGGVLITMSCCYNSSAICHISIEFFIFQQGTWDNQLLQNVETPHLSHIATLHCDVSLTIIHVSGCFCFSDINISQDSVATHMRGGGSFISTLLEIYCCVCRWLNFENRSALDKVRAKV